MIKINVIKATPKKGIDLLTPTYNMVANNLAKTITEGVGSRSCEKSGHENHNNVITISQKNQKLSAEWTSFCCTGFRDTVEVNFK